MNVHDGVGGGGGQHRWASCHTVSGWPGGLPAAEVIHCDLAARNCFLSDRLVVKIGTYHRFLFSVTSRVRPFSGYLPILLIGAGDFGLSCHSGLLSIFQVHA